MGEIDDFDRFWNSYPPRKGDKARTPAKALFDKAVSSGVNPETIIDAALRYNVAEKENHNTPFIMQAQRWLRNKRWLDYTFQPSNKAEKTSAPTQVFVGEGTAQWLAWQEYRRRTKQGSSPCVNFGWWFPTEWPPEETHP